jgi:2'-deoxynucleoside 5'-phosphate N-hydrolase
MKIYFAGSIRGGRDDRGLYLDIIEHLKPYGEVLTEHVGDNSLSQLGETMKSVDFIYERDVAWLQSADVVVAEVTTPSLGVGYEIALAENLKKPILCLFRQQHDRLLSAMIAGNKNLIVHEYEGIDDVEKILSEFFNQVL